MSYLEVVELNLNNPFRVQEVEQLLAKSNIQLDSHLDYTCGIYNESDELIATGSCFMNTIRCVAVDSKYHGEGLMSKLITHLLAIQYQRNHFHVFVYTKKCTAQQFEGLFFHKIAQTDTTALLENQRNGFEQYLQQVKDETTQYLEQADVVLANNNVGSIVMNANPFTLGHLYLIEEALKQCAYLHLFVVAEDVSVFPFEVRKQLIQAGTQHLDRIIIHSTGPYIVSSATFPSYFLKSEDDVIKAQIGIEAQIFAKIAESLNITKRFMGSEPFSHVTQLYNQQLQAYFNQSDSPLQIVEIPRMTTSTAQPISASTVRQFIQTNQWSILAQFVPQSTYQYLTSKESQPIIEQIQKTTDVNHY